MVRGGSRQKHPAGVDKTRPIQCTEDTCSSHSSRAVTYVLVLQQYMTDMEYSNSPDGALHVVFILLVCARIERGGGGAVREKEGRLAG